MTDSAVRPPRQALRRVGAVFAGLLVVVIASTATDFGLAALGVTPPLDPPWTAGGPFLIALGQRLVWQVAGAVAGGPVPGSAASASGRGSASHHADLARPVARAHRFDAGDAVLGDAVRGGGGGDAQSSR